MVAAVLLLASVAVVLADVSISSSPNDLNISPVGSTLQAPSILPQTTPIPALDRQPASHKLIIGNWIAQWDTQYRAWFYYNIKTATSTWTKPAELSHVAFKSSGPTDKKATGVAGGPRQPQKAALRGYRVQAGDLARVKTSHHRQPYSDNLGAGSRLQPAQEKILVSDLETYDFFGYNTTLLSSDRGLLGGLLDSFTGIYDNIVKDYVTDVYTDVIEGYSIATIKLFGWFFFGSMMMFKGLMLDYLVDSGRSFEGRSLGPGGWSLQMITGLDLGVEEDSLDGCYKDRSSCVAGDIQGEVSHLVSRVSELRWFLGEWLGLAGRLQDIQDQGELG